MNSDAPFHRKLVRYYHDCLAAQADWGRALNVMEQRDLTLLPLSASEQQRLGSAGELRRTDGAAVELAKQTLTGGNDVLLQLAALFLVGRVPATSDQPERRFCAPLLEVGLSVRQDDNGGIVLTPEESEFSVNYGMIAELLGDEASTLQDRLEDLAELVPDFPIDEGEFESFWKRFRMIAPELAIENRLPEANQTAASGDSPIASEVPDSAPSSQSSVAPSEPQRVADLNERLSLIDFYVPKVPKRGFRMLPATAILLRPKTGGSLSALAELRQMEQLPLTDTAFSCLFDVQRRHEPAYQATDRTFPDEVLPLPLTPSQSAVLESARSAPLTVVTGPPGTGKSHTIAAIVLDAMLRDQTVLVSSQMDKAVEVVADRVEELAGQVSIARSGGRAAQRQLADKIKSLTGPRTITATSADQTVEVLGRQHYDLTRELQTLEDRYRETLASEFRWSQARNTYDRANQPDWIEQTFPETSALDRVDRLLERLQRDEPKEPGIWGRCVNWWSHRQARSLLGIPSEVKTSPQQLQTIRDLQRLRDRMREIQQQLGPSRNANDVFDQLFGAERKRRHVARELLSQMRRSCLGKLLDNADQRSQLRDLAALLKRRRHEVKQELQRRITAQMLLTAFPAWACTSRSLCEVLPAQPGLFDLVVIDEASQCDLALAAVALLRAKRVVVVGDPHQLRRVCFLSRAREQASLARCQIPEEWQHRFGYRKSLFDVAADMVDQRHFFFLDEHFRSHPQIIDFSNRHFYNGGLRIMTRRPTTDGESRIDIRYVGGRRFPDSSINLAEIDQILAEIRRITSESESPEPTSIGVVCPFRDQVDAIRQRLVAELSTSEIARHGIVVGTAHAFQGDEKDLIFFSTSIDPESHPASLRFLESPNLFNVAVTRARRRFVVVTSVKADQLPQGLLRDYLQDAAKRWSKFPDQATPSTNFQTAIADRLQAKGFPIWTGYDLAGHPIPLATEVNGNPVAILCDPDSSAGLSEDQCLEMHRRLARAGWRVVRVSHRMLATNEDAWMERLVGSG